MNGKILITGHEGMLGTELCKFLKNKTEVEVCERGELDISNEFQVFRKVKDLKPYAIVNCAAYTNVPMAEKEKEKCNAANVKGVENLANAADKFGTRFIHVSTDYVFDGAKGDVYTELDQPKPLNEYGMSKWNGELAARCMNPRSVILRIQWLYGNKASSFLHRIFQKLYTKEKLKIVDDQFGSPSSTLFVSRVIWDVLLRTELEGVYHVAHDNFASWYEFGLFSLLEKGYAKNDVVPIKSSEFSSPVERPKDTRLSNRKLKEALGVDSLGTWEEDVLTFLRLYGDVL